MNASVCEIVLFFGLDIVSRSVKLRTGVIFLNLFVSRIVELTKLRIGAIVFVVPFSLRDESVNAKVPDNVLSRVVSLDNELVNVKVSAIDFNLPFVLVLVSDKLNVLAIVFSFSLRNPVT